MRFSEYNLYLQIFYLHTTVCHHCACPFLLPPHSKCKISDGKSSYIQAPATEKSGERSKCAFQSIEKLHASIEPFNLFQKSVFSSSSSTGFGHLSMLLGRTCCVWNVLSSLWAVPQAIKVQAKIIPLCLGLLPFPGWVSLMMLLTSTAFAIMSKV